MKPDLSTLRHAAVPPASRPLDAPDDNPEQTKREEFRSFLFFTVVMAPILAVLIVSGYGFLVWVYQMFAGPPAAG